MNWFKLLKIAFWNQTIPKSLDSRGLTGEGFNSTVVHFYELEYKRSQVRNMQFKGLPQRRDNILKLLDNNILKTIQSIRPALQQVIGKWLEYHALTDPSLWAKNAVKSIEDNNGSVDFDDFASDFYKWTLESYNKNEIKQLQTNYGEKSNEKIYQHVLSEISRNIDNYPAAQQFLTEMVNKEKLYYKDMLEEFDGDEAGYISRVNDESGNDFTTIEEVNAFLNNDGGFYRDLDLYIPDEESFDRYFSSDEKFIVEDMVQEMYQNLVFPKWYSHWSERGIDSTREIVEEVYKELNDSIKGSVDAQIIALNKALNVAHQTGSMVEHLDVYAPEYLDDESGYDTKNLLTDLSDTKSWPEWDKQIGDIGFSKQVVPHIEPQYFTPNEDGNYGNR